MNRRAGGDLRAGLPDSRPWPSDYSVSNRRRVPGPPPHAFAQRTGQAPFGSRASPFASRFTVPRRTNRVRYPTDLSFTSCSPPRLTTTQLQSVTDWRWTSLERTFTAPTRCALRRTRRGVPAPVCRPKGRPKSACLSRPRSTHAVDARSTQASQRQHDSSSETKCP